MVFNYVIDNGLQAILDNANYVYFCTQEPSTYAEATQAPGGGGYALANAHPGVGNVISGGITNASPDGRKVTTVNGISGAATTAGTIAAWVIIGSGLTGENRVLSSGAITPQAISVGQHCSLNAVDTRLPAASTA